MEYLRDENGYIIIEWIDDSNDFDPKDFGTRSDETRGATAPDGEFSTAFGGSEYVSSSHSESDFFGTSSEVLRNIGSAPFDRSEEDLLEDESQDIDEVELDSSSITKSGVWFEDDSPFIPEEDDPEHANIEEITLFGRYVGANKKNCATVNIMSNATVKELKEQLSLEIGSKIRGISIFDEVVDGDDIFISMWPEIRHGSFLDVLV